MNTKLGAVFIALIPMGIVISWELSLRYGSWIYGAYLASIFGYIFYRLLTPDIKGE